MESTADVVRAAALAGSRLDDTLLANVLGSPVRTVAAALREAMERGVLVARRGRDGIESYAFRHALVREVVRDQLGPGERRELHAAFARELDALVGAARPPAAELAAHWDGAGDARRALPAFVEAARSAERVFAFEAVLRAARRALELWPQVADPERLVSVDRVGLLDRCAHAAGLLGDLDRRSATRGPRSPRPRRPGTGIAPSCSTSVFAGSSGSAATAPRPSRRSRPRWSIFP